MQSNRQSELFLEKRRTLLAAWRYAGPLLLLVIENVWAAGLAGAIRDAGVVFAQQDFVSPEGLVALGAMLGLEVALGA